MRLLHLSLLLSALLLLGACSMPGNGQPADDEPAFRVLVFSRTAGYRHDSIPDGIAAIQELGAAHGFQVTATEDPAYFQPDSLAQFAVVVFLNTSGDVLDALQQEAFRAYIQNGGGFVGVHAASDTEYDWPWYGNLVGAYFKNHPHIQEAVVRVVDRTHPSTQELPEAWTRTDEWYNFRENPRSKGVQVLAVLDETTYEGGEMGEDHPISWYHVYDGGRAWYTAMGHTKESYAEPLFRQHLLGGILWAAGRTQ
ncbi:ThuA domain-containing protein [Rhodothermus marinus]|uniref:ThuA domain-containing protein n=1 Tax=Rhodothermus marinus TaxID=29549 RepID=UPI0012BA4307|nr:ThuA domain-containing protein [Rhodothermus marinus]BBM73039.1 Crp/Fnr family transcriptional regulator [Rhodothermus marinus]